jgi:uncharacterized protein YkwD
MAAASRPRGWDSRLRRGGGDQTNNYRAAHGLPALRVFHALTVNALWKSTDMAVRHYGAHDDGFRSWDQRFRDCGYTEPNAWMRENLAGGNASERAGDAAAVEQLVAP